MNFGYKAIVQTKQCWAGFYLSRNFGAVVPGSLNASCDRDLVANLLEIERLFVGSVWVEEVEEVHVGLVVGRLVTELVQVWSLSQF